MLQVMAAPFAVPLTVQETLPQWTPEHIAAALALQPPQMGSKAAGNDDLLNRNGEAAGESLQNWLATENELANSEEQSLHKIFREHSRAHRRLQRSTSEANVAMRTHTTNASACASSCKSVHNGEVKSYLYYDESTRAGLSDRAWHISHLLALANALCARPVIRAPHELLSSWHNHHKPMNKKWWWDRYLEGVGSLERMGPTNPNGGGGCPWGDSKNTRIGPSGDEKAMARDLKKAAASPKPFTWCLKHNIRSFLGAGGFRDNSVPHEWCDMREPWLGGTEDMTSRRIGERALGPSKLVQLMAQNVTASLGISTFSRLSGAKCTDSTGKPVWCSRLSTGSAKSTEALPGSRGADYSKIMNEAHDAVKKNGAIGEDTDADAIAVAAPAAVAPVAVAPVAVAPVAVAPAAVAPVAVAPAAVVPVAAPVVDGEAEAVTPMPPRPVLSADAAKAEADAATEAVTRKIAANAAAAAAAAPASEPVVDEADNTFDVPMSDVPSTAANSPFVAARRSADNNEGVPVPCDGPFCGQCTSDYNSVKPCCGQDKQDLRASPDLRPCPQSLPSCVEYAYRQHYGRCTSKALEAERKKQFEIDRRRAKQVPPPADEGPAGSDGTNPWERGETGHWGGDGKWVSGPETAAQASPESVDQPKNPWEKGEQGHWGDDGKWVSSPDVPTAVPAVPAAGEASPESVDQPMNPWEKGEAGHWGDDGQWKAEEAVPELDCPFSGCPEKAAPATPKAAPEAAPEAVPEAAPEAAPEAVGKDRVAQRKEERQKADDAREAERARIAAEKERERKDELARIKEVNSASEHELERNKAEKERVRKHEQQRKLENDRRRSQTHEEHAGRKQPQPIKAADAKSERLSTASATDDADSDLEPDGSEEDLGRVAQRKLERENAAAERETERARIAAEMERERKEEQARAKEVDNASKTELEREQAEKERVRNHEQQRKLENKQRQKQTQDDARRTQTEDQASKSSRQMRSSDNTTVHSSMASTVGQKWHANEDENTWLYVLHVRRSDTKLQCDTTVEAVLKYMRCPATRSNEKANHKLIFFTDETSPNYINLLTKKLRALPRWGGGVIHGDAHIIRHLEPEDQGDNYLVYAVASLLMSHADELYEMERCQGEQTCDAMGMAQTEKFVGFQLREALPAPALPAPAQLV